MRRCEFCGETYSGADPQCPVCGELFPIEEDVLAADLDEEVDGLPEEPGPDR